MSLCDNNYLMINILSLFKTIKKPDVILNLALICIMKMLYIRMVYIFNINVGQKIIPYHWLFELTDRQTDRQTHRHNGPPSRDPRPTLVFVFFVQ